MYPAKLICIQGLPVGDVSGASDPYIIAKVNNNISWRYERGRKSFKKVIRSDTREERENNNFSEQEQYSPQ